MRIQQSYYADNISFSNYSYSLIITICSFYNNYTANVIFVHDFTNRLYILILSLCLYVLGHKTRNWYGFNTHLIHLLKKDKCYLILWSLLQCTAFYIIL